MSTVMYDAQKLQRVTSDLAGRRAALRGLVDVAREASDHARECRQAAVESFGESWAGSMADLVLQVNKDLAALDAGSRAHQTARAVLQCAKGAAKAEAESLHLQAKASDAHADLAPLSLLVDRCRKWAGIDTQDSFNR